MGQSASAKIFYGILIYDENNWDDNHDVFEEYEMDVDNIINEFKASDELESVSYGYEYSGWAIGLKPFLVRQHGDDDFLYPRSASADWEPTDISNFLDIGCGYSEGYFDHGQDKVDKLNEIVTALREKGFEIADPTWYLASFYG